MISLPAIATRGRGKAREGEAEDDEAEDGDEGW